MSNQISESSLKQQLNLDPTNAAAAAALGNYYFDQKNALAAIVYYQVSLSQDAAQPSVMTDMATMHWQNEDVGIAEHFFSKVIEQYPEFGNAYINLGLLCMHAKNDVQRAKQLWQHLLAQYPEHPASSKARELLDGLPA